MKFKDVMKSIALGPAWLLTGIARIIGGDHAKGTDGIIGIIHTGSSAVTRFLKRNQTTIATAFWLSLVVAGAAALTLFLWPAALAAVSGFTVAGLSIAAIAGPSIVAQIGLAAAIAFAATSVATYATVLAANVFSFISGSGKNASKQPVVTIADQLDEIHEKAADLVDQIEEVKDSTVALAALGKPVAKVEVINPAPSNATVDFRANNNNEVDSSDDAQDHNNIKVVNFKNN